MDLDSSDSSDADAAAAASDADAPLDVAGVRAILERSKARCRRRTERRARRLQAAKDAEAAADLLARRAVARQRWRQLRLYIKIAAAFAFTGLKYASLLPSHTVQRVMTAAEVPTEKRTPQVRVTVRAASTTVRVPTVVVTLDPVLTRQWT